MLCEICGKTLVGKQRRVCSVACIKERRKKVSTQKQIKKSQVRKICPQCGKDFLEGLHIGQPKKFCSDVCNHITANIRYRATAKGKAVNVKHARAYKEQYPDRVKKSQKVFFASEKGKEAMRRWRQSPLGKQRQIEGRDRFLKTEKGHAYLARHKDTWWGKSRQLIYIDNNPCAICGEAEKLLLECDHIRPRAIGGLDAWDNLQVLCIACHFNKTAIDVKKIRAYRKKVAENDALTAIAEATKHDVYQETVESLEGISNA